MVVFSFSIGFPSLCFYLSVDTQKQEMTAWQDRCPPSLCSIRTCWPTYTGGKWATWSGKAKSSWLFFTQHPLTFL